MATQNPRDTDPVDLSSLHFKIEDVSPIEAAEPRVLGLCSNQPNGWTRGETPPENKRAMADTALLWPRGKELQVYFLNGTDSWGQTIRQAVKAIAPTWSDYANIKFKFTDQPVAHISINLVPGVNGSSYGLYDCFLGTDCAKNLAARQSMNLVFSPGLRNDPGLMEEEFNRVILHEFGHALGFIHEHMRPDRPIRWDVAALNRYCAQNFGWNAQTVQQQIVDEYVPRGASSMMGGGFDPDSIMMYQYPAGVATYDDRSPFVTPNNTALTPMDKVVANMVYPADVAGPDEVTIVPGAAPLPGSIAQPGQVIRYKFTPTKAGVYTIQTQGDTALLVALLARRKDPAGRMMAIEGANSSLAFRPLRVGQDYFIEVRHAKPMSGTGPFSIAVRPPG